MCTYEVDPTFTAIDAIIIVGRRLTLYHIDGDVFDMVPIFTVLESFPQVVDSLGVHSHLPKGESERISLIDLESNPLEEVVEHVGATERRTAR